MVRRIASQVHKQVSRLMRADYIKKEPAWYQAVLNYPPLPLPPKAPPSRTEYDYRQTTAAPSKKRKPSDPHPLPIQYIEDGIRRQFFRDHPFEAFRPTSLVEDGAIEEAHPVQGVKWTRLRQRGRNPTPEDAVRFAVNLHEHHSLPLSEAYEQAVAQFRALRSEHHIATKFAAMEAEHLGAVFGPGEIQHAFEKEKRSLETFRRREELDEGAMAAKKRWKAVVDRSDGSNRWTRGEQYVQLWREGIRPTYSPMLTEPINPTPVAEKQSH